MITLSPQIRFALDIVRRASSLARQVQREMVVEGVAKSDLSPVTVADYAIQALVAHAMSEQLPDDLLVGEESAADLRLESGAGTRATILSFLQSDFPGATEADVCDWIDRGNAAPGNRFWTLDPVDGTKGYLRGEQYAVALALIEDGQVRLGVLGCPNLNEACDHEGGGVMLVAQRGQGAFVVAMDDAGTTVFRPVRASACGDAARARIMRSVEAAHTNIDEVDQIAEVLGVQAEPVRMDSQAKYAVLAAGGGEMLFRLLSPKKPDYKERIWDQAAGSIILEEAGGRITDLRGNPLDFSQGRTLARNTGVFASNGLLHDAGLEAIGKICRLP